MIHPLTFSSWETKRSENSVLIMLKFMFYHCKKKPPTKNRFDSGPKALRYFQHVKMLYKQGEKRNVKWQRVLLLGVYVFNIMRQQSHIKTYTWHGGLSFFSAPVFGGNTFFSSSYLHCCAACTIHRYGVIVGQARDIVGREGQREALTSANMMQGGAND